MNEKKVKDFIKGNIFYFVIVLSAVIYLLTGLITIKGEEKSIVQILSDSFIYFIMAVLISRMFEQQGLLNGEGSEIYLGTLSSYKERVLSITPHINKLDKWCEKDNVNTLKITRTQILSRAGLSYDECFFHDGKARDVYFKVEEITDVKGKTPKQLKAELKNKKEIAKAKNKAFNKAVNVRIALLSSIMLTSNADKRTARDVLSMTRKRFTTISTAKDLVTKIFTIGIFGYFAIDLIQDFSWGKLIEPLIIIFITISSGTIKMYIAERFVKVDEVSVLNLKALCLTRFENDMICEDKVEAERKAEAAVKEETPIEVKTETIPEPAPLELPLPEQTENTAIAEAKAEKESVQ